MKTDYDIHDNEEEVEKYNYSRREFPADPIFTKFFYLDKNDTVKDLYVSVLRKLFKATDLVDEKYFNSPKVQKDFEKIWDIIL